MLQGRGRLDAPECGLVPPGASLVPCAMPIPACDLTLSRLGRRATAPSITGLMRTALETPGLLSLAAGFTDNASLPVTAVAEALRGLAARAPDRGFLQ